MQKSIRSVQHLPDILLGNSSNGSGLVNGGGPIKRGDETKRSLWESKKKILMMLLLYRSLLMELNFSKCITRT